MATTRRKKVSKKVTKKKVVKKVTENKDKFLSSGNLLQLETQSRDIENAKLAMNVEEQNLQNLHLQHALLENKINKQKEKVNNLHARYQTTLSKYNTLKEEIFENYDIPKDKGLGYDALSGKIILN